MKKLLSLSIVAATAALFTGCTGMGAISKNLAKDPAIVVVRLGTPWGTESFTRVGGQNDNVTVSPDGSISITQTKTNATAAARPIQALQLSPEALQRLLGATNAAVATDAALPQARPNRAPRSQVLSTNSPPAS